MKSNVNGIGESVVLVPGGLTGWVSWEDHARRLSKKYRVVRVQLLSVDAGLTDEPLPANYSVRYEAEALARTLEQTKTDRAHFAAWSYGGEITLELALSNPDRVQTLTLIEPPAFWVLRRRGSLPKKLLEEQRIFQSFGPGKVSESQLEHFAHLSGLVPWRDDPTELPQWPVWMRYRQSLRMGDAPHRHEDNIERVRRFERPVLLFKGEGSADYYHKIIDDLADNFPLARVEMLPGRHAPHLASMEEFMRILLSFMESPS